MVEVYLESAAERDLRGLSAERFEQSLPHIRALAEEPRPQGCRKLVGSASDWRIRVGAYWVIYGTDDEASEARVMRVRHRREAYR